MASKSQHFRGVRQRQWGTWVSEIRHPITKTRVWLGSFQCAEEAALAYDEAARFLCGPNANTNFPFISTISNTIHHHHHHCLSLASRKKLRRSCYSEFSPTKQLTHHCLSPRSLISNTNMATKDFRCSTALQSSYSSTMIDVSRYPTFSSWNDLSNTDYNNPKDEIEHPQEVASHDEATHFSINEATVSSNEELLSAKHSAISTANKAQVDECFVAEMINELLTSNSSFDRDFCFVDLLP